MSHSIAQVVVGLPVEGPFDYFIPEEFRTGIKIGQRVAVLFNHQRRLGIIVKLLDKSAFPKLNSILKVLDIVPSVNNDLLKLSLSFADHYGCSRGEALELFLPPKLRTMTMTNLAVVDELSREKESHPKKQLLHHLSFDKQWDYLNEQLENTINKNRSVLLIVPEHHLLKMVEQKLTGQAKGNVMFFNQDLSPMDELLLWNKARSTQKAVVIGTRSAVFTPVKDLGLIIVFNAEDRSYKQEQSPAYHVSAVADMRSALEGIDIIHTGFVPRCELWHKFLRRTKDKVTVMDQVTAVVQMVDLSNYNPQKSSYISFPLQNQLQKTLLARQKAVLMFNRVGFSTLTICNQCGFVIRCERCQVNLTYIYSKKKLVCRYCGEQKDLPKFCPSCRSAYVRSVGTGLEKLESELNRYYPQARIRLFDSETEKFSDNFDILITTQAVVKYLWQLKPDIIAALDYDRWVTRVDFHSAEETLALLVKMRLAAKEKLIIQTRSKDDPALIAIKTFKFPPYYRNQLLERKEANLPPFCEMMEIHLRGLKEEDVQAQAQALYEKLKGLNLLRCEVMEPFADALPKLRDKFRYVIVIKARSITKVLSSIKKTMQTFKRGKKIIITVDREV